MLKRDGLTVVKVMRFI